MTTEAEQPEAQQRPPARPLVELSVLLLLALIGVEFVLTTLFEKPYPSLSGPGFAGSPIKAGRVDAPLCRVEVDCGSERPSMPCSGFVTGASSVRSQVLVDRLFPADCSPVVRKRGFKGRMRERFGLPRDHRRCGPLSPELASWLAEQAGTHCKNPVGLLLRRDSIRLEGPEPQRVTQPLSTVEVKF